MTPLHIHWQWIRLEMHVHDHLCWKYIWNRSWSLGDSFLKKMLMASNLGLSLTLAPMGKPCKPVLFDNFIMGAVRWQNTAESMLGFWYFIFIVNHSIQIYPVIITTTIIMVVYSYRLYVYSHSMVEVVMKIRVVNQNIRGSSQYIRGLSCSYGLSGQTN